VRYSDKDRPTARPPNPPGRGQPPTHEELLARGGLYARILSEEAEAGDGVSPVPEARDDHGAPPGKGRNLRASVDKKMS